MTVGQVIKEERKRRKISLRKLSEMSGVNFRKIHTWEKGTSRVAIDEAEKVLNALSITYVIGGET